MNSGGLMRVSEHITSRPTGFEMSDYAVFWMACGVIVATKLWVMLH